MYPYTDFKHIIWANPAWLWALLLIPLWIGLQRFLVIQRAMNISSTGIFSYGAPSRKAALLFTLPLLRYTALACIIVALARPQHTLTQESILNEGIDIVISMDISGSMLAEDFKPNRIEAAKKVASEFIQQRVADRIGLVIFSGESFSQCPITSDKRVLLEQVQAIRSGLLEDGTAIGMGLATAVERLRDSKAESKVIILLTDGVNNAGLIDPVTALEIAKAYSIKVYTIGVGTVGTAPYPMMDNNGNTVMQEMPVQIDEALLQRIAKETGARYFRATDNSALKKVYASIDVLEKTKIEVDSFRQYKELFVLPALLAMILLLLELTFRYIVFKRYV